MFKNILYIISFIFSYILSNNLFPLISDCIKQGQSNWDSVHQFGLYIMVYVICLMLTLHLLKILEKNKNKKHNW